MSSEYIKHDVHTSNSKVSVLPSGEETWYVFGDRRRRNPKRNMLGCSRRHGLDFVYASTVGTPPTQYSDVMAWLVVITGVCGSGK